MVDDLDQRHHLLDQQTQVRCRARLKMEESGDDAILTDETNESTEIILGQRFDGFHFHGIRALPTTPDRGRRPHPRRATNPGACPIVCAPCGTSDHAPGPVSFPSRCRAATNGARSVPRARTCALLPRCQCSPNGDEHVKGGGTVLSMGRT